MQVRALEAVTPLEMCPFPMSEKAPPDRRRRNVLRSGSSDDSVQKFSVGLHVQIPLVENRPVPALLEDDELGSPYAAMDASGECDI
jgi:hypothetical protein